MLRILQGDALDHLRTLPAQSVQCCVTSPPYWGLRDYGTAQWEGGEAGCDHVASKNTNGLGSSGLNTDVKDDEKRLRMCHENKFFRDIQFRDVCGHCGAHRIDSQFGLEATLEEYIANMVAVFRAVWRVLREDGTLWVNMGDSYCGSPTGKQSNNEYVNGNKGDGAYARRVARMQTGDGIGPMNSIRDYNGLKPKDLCMMPARVAIALQADGWWIRSTIIWHKPNPMPESVTDRPTTSHEYIFLLTKNGGKPLIWRARDTGEWSYEPDLSEMLPFNRAKGSVPAGWVVPAGWDTSDSDHHGLDGNYNNGKTRWKEAEECETPRWKGFDYFYDAEAIREPVTEFLSTTGNVSPRFKNGGYMPGERRGQMQPKALELSRNGTHGKNGIGSGAIKSGIVNNRNKRSVWTIATQPYAGAHFATFPEELPKLCILAGSKPGDMILDPFAGSGTVGQVALELGRRAILIELNPKYVQLIEDRTRVTPGMF